jgi:hypothetical protein
MAKYFDRDGAEITAAEWTQLLFDYPYRQVAFTQLPSRRSVMTVWTGLDEERPGIAPRIYESLGPNDERLRTYASLAAACEGHVQLVRGMAEAERRTGRAPRPEADQLSW